MRHSTARNRPARDPADPRPAPAASPRWLLGLAVLLVALCPQTVGAQVLFAEDFDGVAGPTAGGPGTYRFPAGWTLVNRDGRTPAGSVFYVNEAWERREDFRDNVADSVAFSTSWYAPEGAADDWMITPLIGPLPATGALALKWNAVTYDAQYRDGYEVRLSTGAPTAAACGAGPQLFTVAEENTTWTARSVSLDAYRGQSVYVCFHNNSFDKFLLAVDDVVVERVVEYDAEIVSAALPSAYTQIPLSQTRPLALSATVRNSGTLPLTNVVVTVTVTRDGTPVNVQIANPPTASLAPGASAAFTAAAYTPDASGVYEIAYRVTSSQADQVPANNTATRSQVLSDAVYARDDGVITGSLGIGAGSGGILGQTFGLVRPDVLRSVTLRLTSVASLIGQEIQVEVYDVPPAGGRAPATAETDRGAVGQPGRAPEALALVTAAPAPAAVREPTAGTGGPPRRPPGDPPTVLLGRTVRHIVTAADTLLTVPIEGGGLALDAGDFYLGVVEGDSTLTLGLTNTLFTPGTTWVDWPTSPTGTWANNEAFGPSFAKTYALRANLGVAQELAGTEGWRTLASPAATTVGAFLAPFWTQGFPGADFAGGGCNVYVFDETASSQVNGWTCVGSAAAPLEPGDGLLVYVYEDDDMGVPGIQGGFPKPLPPPASAAAAPFSAFGLTFTDSPSAPAEDEGWNLIGNPFASAFDWDDVQLSGGLSEAVYVFDPSYLGGDYRTWSQGVGGDLANGIVPQNQGFFVQGAATPGAARGGPDLSIPEAAVVGADPAVYGRTAAPDPLRLALAAVAGDGTALPVSATFVAVADGASTGIDAADARRLTPRAWPRAVLATSSTDGALLALNALPSAAAHPADLPLTVTAAGWPTGPLALDLTWSGALPAGWTAVLLDRLADTETPLDAGGRYRFVLDVPEAVAAPGAPPPGPPAGLRASTADVASTGSRFVLRVVPAGVVGAEGPAAGAFGLAPPAPNPAQGAVTLGYAVPEAGTVSLVVYDALGREVAVLVDGPVEAGRHAATLAGASLPSGVYLVRLTAGQEVQTQRLVLLR